MEILTIITVSLYMLSSAGYFAYLFLQKDFPHQFARVAMIAGFACHTFTIGLGMVRSGVVPVQNLHETLSLAAWALAGLFLLVQYKFRLRVLGVYAAPLACFVMVVVSMLPREPSQSKNLLNSFWLISHIMAIFLGEAAFCLACGVGVLYLLQERAIKSKSPGFFFKRLPSLARLDNAGYVCIIVGFTLLTMGFITGLVYAKSVWGRFWSWDPKEVWSAITWLFYAALLHVRLTVGWRGRKAAIMAIVGVAFILFTFFGVNFLLKGHHGEFTRF